MDVFDRSDTKSITVQGRATMEQIDSKKAAVYFQNGFTMVELMIVMFIIAILSAIAMPSFLQWSNNLAYRKTTRAMVSMLREAKSRAIRTNLEHRVEYASTKQQYRMTQGNRSNNSTSWNTVVYDWSDIPANVRMDANVNTIQMNTNGTANGGTIRIQNIDLKTVYEIRVARSGKIRIPAF
jgi:prepilin-type N-terminal cleavage/methylation domain-containing protein